MARPPSRRRSPWGWWWMLLPIVVAAAGRGWWAPDEPRYAEVAREIFTEGDFLVMHLCGRVYPDKPPLLFWLAGLLGWLSGWSELSMRLVSIASTAATAWLVERLARRWFGPLEAAFAPAIFLGTYMVTQIGGRLQIDPLLGLLCTGAIALADPALGGGRAVGRRWLVAGGLVGLGGLAKGPVALANVGLVLAAWYLLLPVPRERRPTWAALAGAVGLAVLPSLTWAAAAALARPELTRELFFGQHLGRVVSGSRHGGPPWKHLVRMPVFLMPWTVPVGLGLLGAFRSWRAGRRGGASVPHRAVHPGLLRAATWLAVLVLFFSAIPSKRDLYLLPAYPPAALLAAHWLVRAVRERAFPRWVGWVGIASLAVPAAALVALGPLVPRFEEVPSGFSWRAPLMALPLLAGSLVAALALRAGRYYFWSRTILVTWALGIATGLTLALPLVDPLKSGRDLAWALAALPKKPSEIPCVGIKPESYRFYGSLRGGLPTVAADSIEPWLDREGPEFLGLLRHDLWDTLDPALKARLRLIDTGQLGSRDIAIVARAD